VGEEKAWRIFRFGHCGPLAATFSLFGENGARDNAVNLGYGASSLAREARERTPIGAQGEQRGRLTLSIAIEPQYDGQLSRAQAKLKNS
jgi:hypothetical protein